MKEKVVVIIPAMNEARHIAGVVKGVRKKYKHVIVVDDGSVDTTAELARRAGARVVSLPKNMGKGFAMRLGAIEALNDGADVVVFMDGDGQHRAEDIARFLEAIVEREIVFGKRMPGKMPFIKKVGNWFLRQEFKILFHHEPGDLLCGFKAVRGSTLEKIMWKADGYFVETEIAARAGIEKVNAGYIEIPCIYLEPGKGTTVKDGVNLGLKMLKLKTGMLREKDGKSR